MLTNTVQRLQGSSKMSWRGGLSSSWEEAGERARRSNSNDPSTVRDRPFLKPETLSPPQHN